LVRAIRAISLFVRATVDGARSGRARASRRLLVGLIVAVALLWVAASSSAMQLGGGRGIPHRLLAIHIPATTYTSNTEWTVANSPYVLDGDVTVAAGATLTIDPGVIVKFNGQFRTMWINGTLSAVGTAANPITFTSYQDDTAGGDTNGDGSATTGAPGQWYEIGFNASGSVLQYVNVRYGGYGSGSLYAPISVSGASASVTIDHATVTNNQWTAVYGYGRATATITNSTLSNNAYGVMMNGATALIDRTTIDNNSARGIYYNLPTTSPLPAASTVTNSEVSGNGGYGVYIGANGDYPLASLPSGTGDNIYSNNSGGIQLTDSGYPSFKNADVNWRGNYWGDGVYFWYSANLCGGTSPNTLGHLAYRSSGGNVPAGPIDGGTYYVQQGYNIFWCGYDQFKLGPSDFSPTKFDTSPRESLGQTFGNSLGKNTTQPLADPVDSATGNFKQSETDVSLPSPGVPFTFTRTYNSLDLSSGELGQGWADSVSASLTIRGNGDVTARGEDGQQENYAKQPNGSFVGQPGALATLTTVSGGYQLTRADQVVYSFDSQGRLTSELDRNGQGLTLSYSGGTLSTVTDAEGRTITFTHSSGLLTKITMPDSSSVSYGYSNAQLTSVTDLNGKVWSYSYDTHGFLASETDPLGHTQFQNTYGSDGRVTQQTDALNHTTTFSWDASTQTETVTDPDNHVWKDVYANDVLTKRIDPQSDTTQFGTDTGLDQTSVTAPSGAATSMTYDAAGNLLTATAPASLGSAEKTFSYDGRNDVTSVIDARGKITSYSYDSAGNLTSVTLAGQQIAAYTYNSKGQVLTSTDGNNKTTTNTYDAYGNLASVTDALGNETTYTYDADGRVLTKVDPAGNCNGCTAADHTTTYTYDTAGRLLTETDPLGHTTTYTYDAAGNKASVTDAKGNTTSYTYDNANHLVTITGPDPDGSGPLTAPITTYTYDAAGNKITQVDPRGNVPGGNPSAYTTTYSYDSNNRLASVTTPTGDKTTYTYDANGDVATVVDPRGNVQGGNPADYTTSYSYDAAGRLLTTTDPLGHTTTNSYDAVGNLASVTDADNHTTSYTYDPAGRILTVTAPDGGVTTYTYDPAGNELTRSDANNHTTTYAYNADSQLLTSTDPLNHATTSTYDPNGNLATTTKPSGGTITYSYDHANRLTSVAYSDSTPTTSYGYDANGNRTSMSDGAGSVSYSYDNLNDLTAVTRGSNTFSYAYDVDGNPTSRTYPDGTLTSYSYDADNRLSTAASNSNTTSYTYDPAGDLTTTTLPSGNGYTETRTYDKAGHLVEVKNANGSTLSDYTATLDPVGNPIQVVQTGAVSLTSSYGYDANDRLTSVCYQTSCPNQNDPYIRWTYDKVGNRLTETRSSGTTNYSYNAADELTAAGSTNYSYDANGNETAAGNTTYTYNLANQLTSVTSGSTTTGYSYDGDGNRTSATTGSQTTNYLWDTNAAGGLPQLALERDGSGNLIRRYIYGTRRISMASGGANYYYQYDLLGSVTNLTSATGATEWTYSYEPFGAIRTQTQNDPNAPANPMQFAGEYLDPTGLYDLRAREYAPATGSFLEVDPSGLALTVPYGSAYSYTGGRPTVMVDPSGATFVPSTSGITLSEFAASGGCGGPAPCPSAGVDRSRVVWYLQRWALSTNPNYGRAGGGLLGMFGSDDCTNFISQALHFGGWTENTSWNFSTQPACAIDPFTGIGGCYGRSPHPSPAWVNVKAFVEFATRSGRATLRPTLSQAQPGDVVIADWQGGTPGAAFNATHMMGITGLIGSQLLVSSHTSDRLNFPLYSSPGVGDSITQEAERHNGVRPTFMLLHVR
jgi:RHS repeat-associated protein